MVGVAKGKNKVLKACVVTREDIDNILLERELRLLCSDSLSENMRPVFYEFMEALPLIICHYFKLRILFLRMRYMSFGNSGTGGL